MFPGLNAPRCMRFWFHMFGPVVGTLRVLLRAFNLNAPSLHEAWSLSGSAGNAWFMAQLTVSSTYEFQVSDYSCPWLIVLNKLTKGMNFLYFTSLTCLQIMMN
jgi:hypothetical protein